MVGRAEELELLRRLRASVPAASAVITGPPGVGKTRLAGAAMSEAAAEGWAALTISGSAGYAGVPLGPFRTVLRELGSSELSELTTSIEHQLMKMRSSQGLFILANDCQDLDENSIGLLHQLVATDSIACIFTAPTGTLPPTLTDLWKNGLAERIELANLSQRETSEVVSAALGGAMEDSSVNRIWQTTGGNPLYLREVVFSSTETGALQLINGAWRWRGEWAGGARLQEIVATRLGRLHPAGSGVRAHVQRCD
jgi:hypothetical protein